MSSLDNYLSRLKSKRETRKQRAKRIAKMKAAKAAIVAEKGLKQAAVSVRKRNTPENRAKVKRNAFRLYNLLKKI